MSDLPTYSVTFVKHPEYGWMPQMDDAMPASLAAHLMIAPCGLTPDDVARINELAATFSAQRLDELADAGLTWEEVRAEQERQRIARLYEI